VSERAIVPKNSDLGEVHQSVAPESRIVRLDVIDVERLVLSQDRASLIRNMFGRYLQLLRRGCPAVQADVAANQGVRIRVTPQFGAEQTLGSIET
jgi:hypothetical protein